MRKILLRGYTPLPNELKNDYEYAEFKVQRGPIEKSFQAEIEMSSNGTWYIGNVCRGELISR